MAPLYCLIPGCCVLSFGVQRFLRFLASGGISTATNFVGAYALLQAGVAAWIANLAAYAVAFAVGYTLQRAWTFEGRHRHGEALPRYLALQVSVAAITALVGHVGALLHMPNLVIALGSTGVSGVLCFLGTSLWVFPRREAVA